MRSKVLISSLLRAQILRDLRLDHALFLDRAILEQCVNLLERKLARLWDQEITPNSSQAAQNAKKMYVPNPML